jgi:ribosomal protein S18 acetylase RimI-like enzyme
VGTSTVADLATNRVSVADAESLGRFFEVVAADKESTRFFHPHPLTKAFAARLCTLPCRDRYYITHYHGRVAAYSMLRGWDEGYETPSFGGCTHPELRGAGLGQMLLVHAIAESRTTGARRLRLTVYKENAPALHVYRKFGFVFSDKNEHELVGLLDLRSPVPNSSRSPDTAKLDAWLKRDQRATGFTIAEPPLRRDQF